MKIKFVKFEKNILVSEYRFIVPFMSPIVMLMIKVIEISRKWFVVLSLLKYKAWHLQRLERYSLD